MIKLAVNALALLGALPFLACGAEQTNAANPLLREAGDTLARVVIVQRPGAMVQFNPQPQVIGSMVDCGLTNLTGQPTRTAAWLSLISTQDIVGIKVFSAPGGISGTRPAVVEAVIQSLVAAGLPNSRIIIWDKELRSMKLAGFEAIAERCQVRLAGSLESGWDTNHFYESPIIGQLVWGDAEFQKQGDAVGRKSYVSKLVTEEMTKIVQITPMLNHNVAGVCGNIFSLVIGSVDNTLRFSHDAQRMADSFPEVYALEILGDRVVLNIVDALLAQYQGEERTLLHYSAVLEQLRFSKDPVALDVLSLRELERQRQIAHAPLRKPNLQLYDSASEVQIGLSDMRQIQVEIAK